MPLLRPTRRSLLESIGAFVGLFVCMGLGLSVCPTEVDAAPPALRDEIDALVARRWADERITPAAPSDDAEFLRRVTLDLTGVVPTAAQARQFLEDSGADKRVRWIETLLTSPEYALQMARAFDVMLIERRTPSVNSYDVARSAWRQYLAESFATDKPWDRLVGEILASDGGDDRAPAAVKFYVARDAEPHQLTRDVGRLFLGVDLQCAQCHDDPRFEDYRQADYYGIYAFLSRTSFFRDTKANRSFVGEKAAGDVTFTSVFTTKQGRTDPRLPGGEMLADPPLEKGAEYVVAPSAAARGVPKYSRRQRLAEQLPRGTTHGFARNLANRLWAMFLGRGLVHPVDLHHAANPPSHPELLERLEQWLIDNDFDLRGCIREIVASRVYQLSSELPAGVPTPPASAFAVAPLRGLSPEQLRWSLLQATGRLESALVAADAQLKKTKPDAYAAERRDWRWLFAQYERLERFSDPIVARFVGLPGQADGEFQPIVDHALFLQNSPRLLEIIKPAPGAAYDRWAAIADNAQLADEIALSVFSRRASDDEVAEMRSVVGAVRGAAERREALLPLVWGKLLSAEFRLNH